MSGELSGGTSGHLSNGTPNGARVVLKRPSFINTARVIFRFTWESTFSLALVAGIVCLVALPVIFGGIFAARGPMSGDAVPFLIQRYDQLVLGLAMPVIALLVGTGAFGNESGNGTLMYIVTTPTPRWWIVFCRVLFAALITAVLSAGAVALTGYLAEGPYDRGGVTRAFVIAVLFGGSVYASLFTLLSLITRRALVAGLGYILLWEGVLGGTFPGLGYLSVRQWTLAVASSASTEVSDRMEAVPSLEFALIAGSAVLVFAVFIAARRLAEPIQGRS